MSPFPNISRIGLVFHLDLSSTDLNINRGHLLIKDYMPTEIEASGAKRSWVISYTRPVRPTWHLTLTFDLLTLISKGIIYSAWTIYLPSLKLLGQSILELSVEKGVGDQQNIWPWPWTHWPEYQFNRDRLLIMKYLPTKFEVHEVRGCWVNGCKSCFGGDRRTDRRTDVPTCAKKYALSFFRRGGGGGTINAYYPLVTA